MLDKIITFIVIFLILSFIFNLFTPTDSTDKSRFARSGLGLYIDNATGCHYTKSGWFGSTTPRLDKDGNHICTGWEFENKHKGGNHDSIKQI